MITDRPEFLVGEYVLLVERPNPLTHLHYFCGSTALSKSRVKSTSLQQRSNSFISGAPNPRLDFCRFPGQSPKRGGRVRAFFFGTVTGKRAYAHTYPQSLAPKMYEEYPRHREVTHVPCLQHLAM